VPAFDDSALIDSPPEEVWKFLYDPSRLPEWMHGVGSVEGVSRDGSDSDFTMYPEGYPDFPMAQQIRTSRDRRRVTVSCQVSFLEFEWTLREEDGDRTMLAVHVELPEAESHRLDDQRAAVRASLERLATVAPRVSG
jgi:uncharacterized protein YndB with AHSA1/START domain